jgi:hypothetical protein
MKKIIYEEPISYYKAPDVSKAILYDDGTIDLIKENGDVESGDWYRDEKTGKVFIPKRRNFISLVKDILRDN